MAPVKDLSKNEPAWELFLRLIAILVVFHPRADACEFPILDVSSQMFSHSAFHHEFMNEHHQRDNQEEEYKPDKHLFPRFGCIGVGESRVPASVRY